MVAPARHRLKRITANPQYRAQGSRSDLALMCAGTDVALALVDQVDGLLDRIHALSDEVMDAIPGDVTGVLLALSNVNRRAASDLNSLGSQVTAPELADVPVMERAVAT